MAFTADQVEELIEALHQDSALRDRVRNAILADDFLALPGLVARLAEVTEQQGKGLNQLTERVDDLTVAIEELRREMANVVKILQVHDGRLGNLEGQMFEMRYWDHLASHLARHFRDVRPVVLGNLTQLHQAADDGRLTEDEFDSVLRVDAAGFARSKASGQLEEVLVVLERSLVVDESDVTRAHQRGRILNKAGFAAVAAVDGQSILPAALALSEDLGVVAIVRKIAEPAA